LPVAGRLAPRSRSLGAGPFRSPWCRQPTQPGELLRGHPGRSGDQIIDSLIDAGKLKLTQALLGQCIEIVAGVPATVSGEAGARAACFGIQGHLASLHWPALLGACLWSIHLGAADADRRGKSLPAPASLAGDPATGPCILCLLMLHAIRMIRLPCVDAVSVVCDRCRRRGWQLVRLETGVYIDGNRVGGGDTSPYWAGFLRSRHAHRYRAGDGARAGAFILPADGPAGYGTRDKLVCIWAQAPAV
jgi:hypothetical protein